MRDAWDWRSWVLPATTLGLAGLLAYVLFGAYMPSLSRMIQLETELKDVYRKEADLHLQLAQAGQRIAMLERQVAALTAERDALAERLKAAPSESSPPRPGAALLGSSAGFAGALLPGGGIGGGRLDPLRR
jgi:hypothetical protein